ncbi:MAG: hypothetical protein V1738_02800 [Patescibacteria group bacterium]
MNSTEQRNAAIAQVKQAIDEQGLVGAFGAKAVHRFLEFLKVQLPSVAQRYADNPNSIRSAIETGFTNLPDDADATIMPVRGGQSFGRRPRK